MIVLQKIEKLYATNGHSVHALAGVCLNIDRGEFVAITGPSGSGKSSLLNILGCLDLPSTGHYFLEGVDVATLDDESSSDVRNRRVGFVFQSFHLLPRLSVLENTLLPLRFARKSDTHAPERALALLRRVGLDKRLHHFPTKLSGGEMQRAAIARALLMQPALLLADEPTGNLDSKNTAVVLALFRELHCSGQTVVLVTHDTNLAKTVPRQVRLHDGRIVHDSL